MAPRRPQARPQSGAYMHNHGEANSTQASSTSFLNVASPSTRTQLPTSMTWGNVAREATLPLPPPTQLPCRDCWDFE